MAAASCHRASACWSSRQAGRRAQRRKTHSRLTLQRTGRYAATSEILRVTVSPKKQPVPFGKYLLLDRVNIGGMAEVWRGTGIGPTPAGSRGPVQRGRAPPLAGQRAEMFVT